MDPLLQAVLTADADALVEESLFVDRAGRVGGQPVGDDHVALEERAEDAMAEQQRQLGQTGGDGR